MVLYRHVPQLHRLIQAFVTVFFICQPLDTSRTMSKIRTDNPIYDPHRIFDFSNRGVTVSGI